MGRERERPSREDREENERPKTGVDASREADKDDIIDTLFGRKRSPNNEDGETEGGQPDSCLLYTSDAADE